MQRRVILRSEDKEDQCVRRLERVEKRLIKSYGFIDGGLSSFKKVTLSSFEKISSRLIMDPLDLMVYNAIL